MSQSAVKPIPEGMRSLTPHLVCAGAAEAIEFYKRAFNAIELGRMPGPDGKLMHAMVKIGDSMLMLVDEFPQFGSVGPKALNGSPVTIHLYVEDADATREAGRKRRRESHDARRRHVLGRPLRASRRPVRSSMVGRDAYA